MKVILLLAILATVALTDRKDPPIFNYSYQVSFVETFLRKTVNYTTTGRLFYDPINKRERVDWDDGTHNGFCYSTHYGAKLCISLTTNGKRWQIFPEKGICCLCCTASRYCDILRPDWMKGGKYEG
jgi:hypothetical protein